MNKVDMNVKVQAAGGEAGLDMAAIWATLPDSIKEQMELAELWDTYEPMAEDVGDDNVLEEAK